MFEIPQLILGRLIISYLMVKSSDEVNIHMTMIITEIVLPDTHPAAVNTYCANTTCFTCISERIQKYAYVK